MCNTFPHFSYNIVSRFFSLFSWSLPVIFVYRAAPCISLAFCFYLCNVFQRGLSQNNKLIPPFSPFVSLFLSLFSPPLSFASLYQRYQVGMRCRLRFVVSLAINFMSPMVISVDLQRIKTSARGRSPIARRKFLQSLAVVIFIR